MKHYIVLSFLMSLGLVGFSQNVLEEELIIFVQSTAESDFTKKNIGELQEYMQSKSIPVRIIDIQNKGAAPKEVGYTPFIVYQNHLGRKIYKGRYTSHHRILNFIRTVKYLGQQQQRYNEEKVFVWKHGRMRLGIKTKITDPTGKLPSDFDINQFKQKAQKGLVEGLSKFKYYELAEITKADELFYFNFYANVDAKGQWFVSTEIYSHYDCVEPIYIEFKSPAKGETIEKVFAQAAKTLQAELVQQLSKSKLGDAMTIVSAKFPTQNWNNIGIDLPPSPTKSATPVTSILKEVPQSWTYAGAYDERPALQFRFPDPLTQYAGELKEIEGTLELPVNNSFEAAEATFEVRVQSLTMGLVSLEKAVKEKMLHLADFPAATLRFNKILGDELDLGLGKIAKAKVKATLTIMDKNVAVEANTQVEPFVSDTGEPRLYIQTSFEIADLEGSLGIDGPEGPTESKNRMIFSANFVMKPVD